jgi:hypothetical protein
LETVTGVVTVSDRREDRPALNLRVNVRIKAAFEREIVERHGMLRPYAGTELERELASLVGDGRLADLTDAVHRLSDALGEDRVQKKTQTPSGGDATVARYRIRESVRNDLMRLAEQADVTYPRDLVERVMWDYAQGRSSVDKAVDRMRRIRDRAESELDASDSTTERRTMTIANALSEDETDFGAGATFKLDEFDDAVDNHVTGISSGSYARKQYLAPVLEEMGYTWHPDAPVFVSEDEPFVPDERDPRTKPYLLMDRDDKIEALREDAIATAADKSDTKMAKYTTSDGVAALEGKPARKTVAHLFRAIAEDSARFTWDDENDTLKVDLKTRSQAPAESGSVSMDQLSAAQPAHEVEHD